VIEEGPLEDILNLRISPPQHRLAHLVWCCRGGRRWARPRRHIVARPPVRGCKNLTNSLPRAGCLAGPTSLIVCAAGHTVLALQAAQPVQAPKEGL
jgi:hypothetical protein